MPSFFNPPRASASPFDELPAPLGARSRSASETLALRRIWDFETSLFERAWLWRLCAQGELECALSWLSRDEALFDIFGLCPSNAPGRVWDRLARASGLRRVDGGSSGPADERCQRLARAAGAHQLFPPERRERLRRALWRQAQQDFAGGPAALPPGAGACLPWPPPPERLALWLASCRSRADEARSEAGLRSALLARAALERAGFAQAPL